MTPPTGTLTLDRDAARLSDTVRATVTVEGAAPLVVTPPAEVLAGDTAAAWAVTPDGPAAVEPLPGGRERWVQAYRLSPFLPGDGLAVRFAPFPVAAGGANAEVAFPERSVTVRTAITDPKPADARPITGVEDPPGPPAGGAGVLGVVPVVSVAAAVLLIVGAAVARRRRKPVPPTPAAWAEAALAAAEKELEAETIPPALFADRLADVLRGYVERRYGLPATRRTTGELLAAAGADLPADAVRAVLEWADLAKFAGRVPAADECRRRAADARAVWTPGTAAVPAAPAPPREEASDGPGEPPAG
jgi:hypothetical protein